MSENKKLPILISIITLLIFVVILFLNINKAPITPPNALHQEQNQINSSGNYNFTAQEVPVFNFPSVAYASDLKKNVSIYNSDGEKMNADITASANGNGSSIQVNKTQQFIPGKYSLVVNQDGKKIEQNFTWGVLAINPNKSIYTQGEIAKLSIAVLDEKGAMVCDAKVTLDIKNPSGQTTTLSIQNGTIIVNPECTQKKYTVNPDYEAKYQVGSFGNYQMSLTAVTANGIYNIVDFFAVEENAEFDVERTIATRIFPYSIYPVSIKIIAKKDFSGQIREPAPLSFTITPLENTIVYNSTQKTDDAQYILWDVSLKKGESINIGYNFKAPLVSPQFYLLGPLSLSSNNQSIFAENRSWQLAIDAIEYAQTILNDNPVAYWRLGEASGLPQDASGNGNHVSTVTGTPTYSVAGALAGDADTAILFDGVGELFTVPDANSLDFGNGPFTWECWVKRTNSGTGVELIIDKGTQGEVLFFNNKFIVDRDSGGIIVQESGTTTDTNWHHFVWTRSGTGSGNNKIYKDGVDVTTDGAQIGLTLSTNTRSLHIGAYDSTQLFLNGSIDEVALYNVELSAATVLDHYSTGVAQNAGNFRFDGLRMEGIKIN